MSAETFLGGALTRHTTLVEVPDFHGEPYPTLEAAREAKREYLATHTVPVIPGSYWWEAGGKPVSDDTARAMFAQAGREVPGPGCVYCGSRRGPFKEHCGTGDMVCMDDDGCLGRGWRGTS